MIFKQLLQAGAIDVCQIDACRLGGVNEVMAVLLISCFLTLIGMLLSDLSYAVVDPRISFD